MRVSFSQYWKGKFLSYLYSQTYHNTVFGVPFENFTLHLWCSDDGINTSLLRYYQDEFPNDTATHRHNMHICVFLIHMWNLCRSLHTYKRKIEYGWNTCESNFVIFASVLKNRTTSFKITVHYRMGHFVHSQLYSTSIFAFPFLKYRDTPLLLSHQRGRQQKPLTIIYNSFCKPNTSVHRIMIIGTC